VLSRCRIKYHVVAIGVPLVPVVARRRFANLVLRLLGRALNSNELALANARSALRSGNFYFAFADEYFSMIVARNQNSKTGIALLGTNRNVRSVDLRIRIAIAEHGIVRHSACQLNLNLRARQLREVGLGMFRKTKGVRIVKLKLCARFIASRNAIAGEHGSVNHSRRPASGVATLCGHVAVNQADARHAVIFHRRWRVVTRIVRSVVAIQTRVHRPTSARTLIVGTLIRRTLIVSLIGALIIGLIGRTLVGRLIHRILIVLHGDVGRRFRVLILILVVRILILRILIAILSEDSAWNRHRQS
jgi:hypothetical protein